MDRVRWFEFIVSLHRSDTELSAPTLSRWLIEVGKWSDEGAHELACEFEFAMGLLDHETRG